MNDIKAALKEYLAMGGDLDAVLAEIEADATAESKRADVRELLEKQNDFLAKYYNIVLGPIDENTVDMAIADLDTMAKTVGAMKDLPAKVDKFDFKDLIDSFLGHR